MESNDVLNVKRSDLFRYTFYDEQHKVVAVLNKEKLAEILDADKVILDEEYN